MAQVMEKRTSISAGGPERPLFVTPLGIAMHDNHQLE